MAHTVTGKLNKPAREFQAGEYAGFGIGLGVQYYDRQTKQKEWTNYKIALFTKSPQQIDFYRQSLVAGSVVSVSAKHQKIDSFEGNNGAVVMIELLEASLDFVHTSDQPQQQAQPQAPQQYQQAAPQQQRAPQQQYQHAPQSQGFDDTDDSIPF